MMKNFNQFKISKLIFIFNLTCMKSKILLISILSVLFTSTSILAQVAPTTQASEPTTVSVTSSTFEVNWTSGNGANRIVAVKENSGTVTPPSDNVTYSASSNYLVKGTELGSSGYYVVYNGSGNSAQVTHLKPNTSYFLYVYEYNGSGGTEKYNITIGTNYHTINTLGLFTEIAGTPFTPTRESAIGWGDYDGDGYLDMLLAGNIGGGQNETGLYYNNAGASFSKVAGTFNDMDWGSIQWADYDHDGDIDALVSGEEVYYDNHTRVYRNDGGTFVMTNIDLNSGYAASTTWCDFNNDGKLDILVTALDPSISELTNLYKNEGNDVFTEVFGHGLPNMAYGMAAWGDIDKDGWIDLAMTGLTDMAQYITKIYRNNGNATFTEIASFEGLNHSTIAWGDYDNDGDLDFLQTGKNAGNYDKTYVYRNEGSNTFIQQAFGLIGVYYCNGQWGDIDNDGWLDIIIAGSGTCKIYRNNGDNSFTNYSTNPILGIDFGNFALGDYDRDSDLDLFTAGEKSSVISSKLFRNDAVVGNSPPTTPSALVGTPVSSSVTLSWSKANDAETPQNGLTYNVYIRDSSGNYIVSPASHFGTGLRSVVEMGNVQQNTAFTFNNLKYGTYYWSVQAIDASYAGGNWATEQNFVIPITAPTVQASNITFEYLNAFNTKITWTRGNGDSCIVAIRANDQGTITNPTNNHSYPNDYNWNYGITKEELGTSGYFVVYNGSGNSVTINDFMSNATYWVQIFEYNGTAEVEAYNVNTEFGNPSSLLTPNTNFTPVAFDDAYTMSEEGTLSENVFGNDLGLDDNAVASLWVQALNGTAIVSSNGDVTYTPNLDYFGNDNFTYKLTDNQLETSTATVYITIDAVNDAPIITSQNGVSIPQNYTRTLNFADLNVTDVDNTYPTGFIITIIDGTNYTHNTTSFTPALDYTGNVYVQVYVSDGAGGVSSTFMLEANVYDNIKPAVTITSPVGTFTNLAAIPVTITFSEPISGFTSSSISVTNATVSNFATVDAKTYTADLMPVADGTITAVVNADVVMDYSTNYNDISNTFSTIYDGTDPTLTIINLATNPTNLSVVPISIPFSEAVTGFELTDLIVTNGTASNLNTSDNITFTADITPASEGTVSIQILPTAAFDAVGNGNYYGVVQNFVSDITPPTVSIASALSSPTNQVIPITITFSEGVTGFTSGDVTVANGTINTFVPVSSSIYTADIIASSDGTVQVDVASGVATDNANNGNTVSNSYTVVYDNSQPTLVISCGLSDPTKDNTIMVYATFSEPVTGFASSDITVVNCNIIDFVPVDAYTSYFVVTASSDGLLHASVSAGMAFDAAGNGNAASNLFAITYDGTSPSVVISTATPSPTSSVTVSVSIAFSEIISNFDVSDIAVNNANISNLVTFDNINYTADISPVSDGTFDVSISSLLATDNAGNGNSASNLLSMVYDATDPTVMIVSVVTSPTNQSSIPITITFSEAVSGFTLSDFMTINATVSNLLTSDNIAYTANVTPTADGAVEVSMTGMVAYDVAGNGNSSSNTLSIDYDGTTPMVTISTTATDPTNVSPIPVSIVFSEDVTGFTISDLMVTNGTAGSFIQVDAANYTAVITPVSQGTVTIDISANMAIDAAMNGNTVSNSLSVDYDNVMPSVNITSPVGSASNTSPIPITIVFSENVNSFISSDLTVFNCAVINFVKVSATIYTADLVPAGTSLSVSVSSSVAIDAAGNTNTASNTLSIIFDMLQPSVSISSAISSPTNTNPIPVTITFSEVVSGLSTSDFETINCTMSNLQTISSSTYQADLAPFNVGTVSLSLPANSVVDAATNGNQISNLFSIDYDNTSPVVAISSPTGNSTVNGAVAITFTSDEMLSPQLSVDNINWTNATSGTTTFGDISAFNALPDGLLTLYVRDFDAAGNVGLNLSTYIKDAIPPTIVVTSPVNNTSVNDNTTFIFTSDGINPQVSVDNSIWITAVSGITKMSDIPAYSAIAEGFIFYMYVRDEDVIANTETIAISYVKDNTAPVLAFVSSVANDYVSGTTVISFTDSELNSPKVSVDNINWTNVVSGTTTFAGMAQFSSLANGSFTLYLTDTDIAGNTGTTSIAVNKNAPNITAQANTLITQEETAITLQLSDLLVNSVTYPSGFSLSVLSGSNYTYTGTTVTPDLDFVGNLTIPVQVSEGAASSNVFNMTVSVTSVNDAPIIVGQNIVSIFEESPYAVSLSDLSVTDVDNVYPTDFSLTVSAGSNYTVSGNTITPNLNYVGTLMVQVTVSDGQSNSNVYNLNINVNNINDAPVITSQNIVSILEDTPRTIDFADLIVTDVDNSYSTGFILTVASGTNYTVSGNTITPALNYFGTLTVPVYVTDGITASNVYNLTISVTNVNDAPVIVSQSAISTAEETPLTISFTDLNVTDIDNTYPTGFSITVLSGSNYTFSGTTITPATNFFGTLTVPVYVSDGQTVNDTSNVYNLTISVTNVNDAPVITGQNTISMQEEAQRTIAFSDLVVNDVDNTYPNGFTITVLSGSNYSLSGNTITPVTNFYGTLTVPVKVSDGQQLNDVSNTYNLTVNVTNVNDVPIITGQNPISITEDASRTVILSDLLVSDLDNTYPNGFTLTVLNGTNYTHAGNTITPDLNFNGIVYVLVKVSDGQADSYTYDLQINVNAVNDAPVITGQTTLATNEETALTISLADILATDVDNTYPTGFTLSILNGANYAHSGSTITPANNFTGTLTVQVQISDGQTVNNLSNIYGLQVTVINVNDAPAITGQVNVSTLEETPVNVNLSDLYVSDVDNNYPSNFTLTILEGANYTFVENTITPADNFVGTLNVPLQVSDGQEINSLSNTYLFKITVTNINDAPIITGQKVISIVEESVRNIAFSDLNVSDVDNNYPNGFLLSISDGANYTRVENTITPDVDFFGTLTVPVQVSDGLANSNTFELQITVTNVNDAPIVTAQNQITMNEDALKIIELADLYVTDIDNEYPIDFTLSILDGTNYTHSGTSITPSQNFFGSLTVPVKVFDGVEFSNVFDLQILVSNVNDAPTIASQNTISILEESSKTIEFGDLNVTDVDNVYPSDFTLSISEGANYTMAGNTITPVANFFGTLTVPVQVFDGLAVSNIFNLTITVGNVNDAPIITGQKQITILEEAQRTVVFSDLYVNDIDNTYSTGFTLTVSDGVNYTHVGNKVTPATNFNGILEVPVQVSDGQSNNNLSNVYTLLITVTPVNDAPNIWGQNSVSILEETPRVIDFADLNVTDVDNSYPSGFTLTVANGTNYSRSGNKITPANNFVGTLSVPAQVSDGQTSNSMSNVFYLQVTVTNVNDAPVIVSQSTISTLEETDVAINLTNLTVNDVDNNYPSDFTLTILDGANYTHLTNVITPTLNFVGTLTVPVQVFDGVASSNIFNLKITVTNVNDAPQITAQIPITILEEAQRTIEFTDITVTDADNLYPNGFTLSVLHGDNYTVSGKTITPVTNFVGLLYVPVQVSDGQANSNVFYLLITVNGVNDAPIISGQNPIVILEETPRTIEFTDLLVTDVDNTYPDGFMLTVLDGGNYTRSGNTITPSLNFVGTLTVPVRVSDGQSVNSFSTVYNMQVTVTNVNDAPVITGQLPIYTQEEVSVAIPLTKLTVTDVDNAYPNDFTITVLEGNNYTFEGNVITSVLNFYGTLSVLVQVSDGLAQSNIYQVQISVSNVNDEPIFGNFTKNGIVNTAISFTQSDFTAVYSDVENTPLQSIKIAALPLNGKLMLNTSIVSVNQVINTSLINSLKFVPNNNWFGINTFECFAGDGSSWSLLASTISLQVKSPQIVCSPVTVDYGIVVVSPTETQNALVSIENTGDTVLVLSNITGLDAPFTQNNQFPKSVNPSESVELIFVLNRNYTVAQYFDTAVVVNNSNQASFRIPIYARLIDSLYANAGDDTIVCSPNYTLAANIPLTNNGLWEVLSGDAIVQHPTLNSSPVSNLSLGENLLRWTVSNGMSESSDEVMIYNDMIAANTGNDYFVCNDYTTLSANLPVNTTGLWNSPSNLSFENPTSPTSFVTLNVGSNILVWTLSNENCSDNDTLVITNHRVTANISAGDADSVCSFEYMLHASQIPSGHTGFWRYPSGVYVPYPNSNITEVSKMQHGENEFIWTITNGFCYLTDSMVITNLKPYAYAGNEMHIYSANPTSPDTLEMTANQPDEGAFGLWRDISNEQSAVFVSPSDNNSRVYDLHLGLNSFEWAITQNNCTFSDTVDISKGLIFIPTEDIVYWSDTANWNQNTIPSVYDSVYIATVFGDTVVVSLDMDNPNCYTLLIGSGTTLFTSDLKGNVLKLRHITVGADEEKGESNFILGAGTTIEVEPELETLGFKGNTATVVVKTGGRLTVKPDVTKFGLGKGNASLVVKAGGRLTVKPDVTKKGNASVVVKAGGRLTVKPDVTKGQITTPGEIYIGDEGELIVETTPDTYTEVSTTVLTIGRKGRLTVKPDVTKLGLYGKLRAGQVKSGRLTVKPDVTKPETDSILSVLIGKYCSLLIDPSEADSSFETYAELGENQKLYIENGGSINLINDLYHQTNFFVREGSQIIDMNDTNTIIGNAEIEKDLFPGGHQIFTAPVNNTIYRTSADLSLLQYSEPLQNFSPLADYTKLLPATGYLANCLKDTIFHLSGSLNAGNILKDNLTYTNSDPNLSGWNLVGNPYISYLNWNSESILKQNIDPVLYTWNSTNFAYYLSGAREYSLNGGNNWISPKDGFLVKAKTNQTGSILFTNQAQHFVPTAKYSKVPSYPLIHITLSNAQYSDEAVIRYLSEATEEFDSDVDAVKLFSLNSDVPQIYTSTPLNTLLAINSLPVAKNEIMDLPIMLTVGTQGIYTISFGLQNMDTTQIYLNDVVTGTLINLNDNPVYMFVHDSTQLENRFRILINPVISDIENPDGNLAKENIEIYSAQNVVFANVQQNAPTYRFEIFDLRGQLIYTEICSSNHIQLKMNQPAGCYVVKITSGKSVTTKRVFINY